VFILSFFLFASVFLLILEFCVVIVAHSDFWGVRDGFGGCRMDCLVGWKGLFVQRIAPLISMYRIIPGKDLYFHWISGASDGAHNIQGKVIPSGA